MELETLKSEIEAAVPGCRLEIIPNPSPSAQHSLLVDPEHGLAVACYLRDTAGFNFCTNVTGVDWPPKELSEKIKVKQLVDGVEKEVDEVRKTTVPGYLEAVYHLYSIERKLGPLPLRMRTSDRGSGVHLPSLTPVWRSAEFQEREIFDLYGILFDGHPDLRRILCADDWEGFPLRKDYVFPREYHGIPASVELDWQQQPDYPKGHG
jgi:NADH-quinone oxidoreductase subunit C